MLILDEPTRGIDVGAKVEVHQIDRRARRAKGMAIILISSDLPEVLAMSDRILVMREGRQMAILGREEATAGARARGGDGPAGDILRRRGSTRRRGRCGDRRLAARSRYRDRPDLRRVRPSSSARSSVLVIIVVAAFFATQIPISFDPRTSTGSARASP